MLTMEVLIMDTSPRVIDVEKEFSTIQTRIDILEPGKMERSTDMEPTSLTTRTSRYSSTFHSFKS